MCLSLVWFLSESSRLLKYNFYMCAYIYLCMSMHTHMPCAYGFLQRPEEVMDLLELELQVFVSHLMWPLEADALSRSNLLHAFLTDGQRDKRYCFILTSYVYGYPREVLKDSSMAGKCWGRVRRAKCELSLSLC